MAQIVMLAPDLFINDQLCELLLTNQECFHYKEDGKSLVSPSEMVRRVEAICDITAFAHDIIQGKAGRGKNENLSANHMCYILTLYNHGHGCNPIISSRLIAYMQASIRATIPNFAPGVGSDGVNFPQVTPSFLVTSGLTEKPQFTVGETCSLLDIALAISDLAYASAGTPVIGKDGNIHHDPNCFMQAVWRLAHETEVSYSPLSTILHQKKDITETELFDAWIRSIRLALGQPNFVELQKALVIFLTEVLCQRVGSPQNTSCEDTKDQIEKLISFFEAFFSTKIFDSIANLARERIKILVSYLLKDDVLNRESFIGMVRNNCTYMFPRQILRD